jgi:hypothetical protein
MRYQSLSKRKVHFKTFTGLSVEEFDDLVTSTRKDWEDLRITRLTVGNPNRVRNIGAGRKKILDAYEDQLLLTVMWLKTYSAYALFEYLFCIDESTVQRTIAQTLPLLQSKFLLPFPDPRKQKGRKKITSWEEMQKAFPDIDEVRDILLGDATEQKVPRPEKKVKRKKYHSGKKKSFTIKTQIIVNGKGLFAHVSPSIPGRTHDYKLFKASDPPNTIPKDVPLYLDSGYQGVNKDFPHLNAIVPFKRNRSGKDLTRSQKIFNTKQRKTRVPVEHSISKIKKYKVLSDTYRNSLQNYNSVFKFVCNIVNFRTLHRLTAAPTE